MELVDRGTRGGQRNALSTASVPVRNAHCPQIHSAFVQLHAVAR
jgi:hypothetical protein